MRWVRRLIGVAIVVAVLIGGWWFAAENSAPITVYYLWGSRELSLWQALVAAFALGLGVAATVGIFFAVRARLVQREYRKALDALESEIHQLRNLPLVADPPALGGSEPAPPRDSKPRRAGGRNG